MAWWHRSFWQIANRLESAMLRNLGTSGVALIGRRSVLVLETTGRRSGRRRRTPVAYWRDADGALFIGAGAAGMSCVDWVANLRTQPVAAVWVGRRKHPVVAVELVGAAADEARGRAVRLWPEVARYQRMSGRAIPYFRLDPTQHGRNPR